MTTAVRRSLPLVSTLPPRTGRGWVPWARAGLLVGAVAGLTACPAAPPPAEQAPPAGATTGAKDDAGAAEGGSGGAASASTGGTDSAPAAAGGTTGEPPAGTPAADTSGGTAGGTGSADPETSGTDDGGGTAGDTGGVVDEITPLLDEAKKKKTSDAKATQLFDDAKAKGAPPTDVAKAANARGVALMGEPERAKPFFEYAMAADEKYPDAPFNLAKLAANEGDIERVKELLTEVKARGGKKLLKTVGFDPTFALVAGEPDVEKLLK